MIYQVDKQEPYLSYILSGVKTVEGRLNKGKFRDMKNGDIIETNRQKFLIEYKKEYKTFKDMIKNEGIKNVIPDKTNLDDAVNVYYKFYTKEQEKQFGVLAIKVKKIN